MSSRAHFFDIRFKHPYQRPKRRIVVAAERHTAVALQVHPEAFALDEGSRNLPHVFEYESAPVEPPACGRADGTRLHRPAERNHLKMPGAPNGARRDGESTAQASSSPLAGKVFDEHGEPLYAQGAAKAHLS